MILPKLFLLSLAAASRLLNCEAFVTISPSSAPVLLVATSQSFMHDVRKSITCTNDSSSLSASNNDENPAVEVVSQEEKGQQQQQQQQINDPTTPSSSITLQQKMEVILYRTFFIAASISFTMDQALVNIFLSPNSSSSSSMLGLGGSFSLETISSLQQTCHLLTSWFMLLSALLAPAYLGAITDTNKRNEFNNAIFLLLNELLPNLAGFAIFFEVVRVIQENVYHADTSKVVGIDGITYVFISLLAFREIGFYGVNYKAEGVLAVLFCIALSLNDVIGFSEAALMSGLVLSLLVLSFAKVFEPLEDDLVPNQSAFFLDGGSGNGRRKEG